MSYRASLLVKYKGHCFYCNADVLGETATADHFIPRSKGGPNSEANRVLACIPCNQAKGNIDPRKYGISEPHDPSPDAQKALLRFRAVIIARQLDKLAEEPAD